MGTGGPLMPRRKVRRIYLAGPITGCNEDQKKVWRDRIRRSWPEFKFYCPVERLEELSEKPPVSEFMSQKWV